MVFFDEIDAIGGARFDDGAGELPNPATAIIVMIIIASMTSSAVPSWCGWAMPGGDNEVQRTMLEIVNQLDGFDSRGNIKV